jgi:hypothetical protein
MSRDFCQIRPADLSYAPIQCQPPRLAGRMVLDHNRNPEAHNSRDSTSRSLRYTVFRSYKDSSQLQRIYTIAHEQLQYNYAFEAKELHLRRHLS